jgi:hypothetical protein
MKLIKDENAHKKQKLVKHDNTILSDKIARISRKFLQKYACLHTMYL